MIPPKADPPEVEAIRARAEKASSGPWCIDNHIVHPGDTPEQWHVYQQFDDDPPLFSSDMGTREDAEFIACARHDIPYLLDLLSRQSTALKEMQEQRRAVFCLYCDAKYAYTGDPKEAWEWMLAHDATCEKNPHRLRAESAESLLKESHAEIARLQQELATRTV